MIGLQCVQRATAAWLSAHIACLQYNYDRSAMCAKGYSYIALCTTGMIDKECVQKGSLHTLHACNASMIGMQCMQRVTTT